MGRIDALKPKIPLNEQLHIDEYFKTNHVKLEAEERNLVAQKEVLIKSHSEASDKLLNEEDVK